MNRLTEFAVNKRSVILLLAAALFLAGIYSWSSLKQELLPDIEFPIITIVAPYPGAGASDVTDQVTRPIERAVSGIPRLERLQSTSANSIGIVVAQFSYGTNVKEARASIESNLSSVGLPQGVSPEVTALNINETPVIVASIAATGEDGLTKAADIARTDVVPALLGLEGVGSVEVTGGLEERVLVTLDPAKLADAGISVQQINGVLAANNLTLPAGQLPQDGTSVPVSTTGIFSSLDDIRGLIVGAKPADAQAAQGTPPTPITIGDVGTVDTAGVPTTGYARTDGEPSVTITVSKSSGANTVDVADRVQAELAAAQARNPGLTVVTVSDLSTFIKESRDGLLKEGGLGAVFAIITIFLFLLSLRSTLVAAVSIPLSILAALTLMLVTGISMNIMTLGGLAVAVGRVVDDAIVVLENIYRHRARGDDRRTAALSGTREVSGAITASTATTVAVFLPLGFVGGLVSQFFLPFALTVTFALLASLLCAVTVVPVLAYFLVDRVRLDVDENGEPRHSFWVRAYTPTIKFVLRNRRTKWGVIALSTLLFVGSLALVPQIPTQFINAGGEKLLTISISPPQGTSSQAVLDRTIEAEKLLQADPNVERVLASVPGEGGTGLQTVTAAFAGRAANSSTVIVRLDDSVDLKEYAKKLTGRPGADQGRRLRRRGLRGHGLQRWRHQRHRQLGRSGARRLDQPGSRGRTARQPGPHQREERPGQGRAHRRGGRGSQPRDRGRAHDGTGGRRGANRARAAARDPHAGRRRPAGGRLRPGRPGAGQLGRGALPASGRARHGRSRSARSPTSARLTPREASPASTSAPPPRSPPRSRARTPAPSPVLSPRRSIASAPTGPSRRR